jgi:hypothetical protein
VQRLGQLLLGQALPPALLGNKRAEKLFVQSDHLTDIVTDAPKKATDCWFTVDFPASMGRKSREKAGYSNFCVGWAVKK